MSMITPSPAEIVLIKAEARRRFGSDRALCVQLGAPIGAAVVVAPFDLRSYSAHVDARAENASTAQAGAIVDRLLWCSPASPDEAPVDTIEPSPDDPTPLRRVALARLELLRDTWPAVDGKVEADLRSAAGEPGSLPSASPLTLGTLPPGLSVKAAEELLRAAPATGPSALWGVRGTNGCSLVMRAPLSDVYLAVRAAFGDALAKKSGQIDSVLVAARQHIVWSPEPLDALFDRKPVYAEEIWHAFFQMGGSAAASSATFL